MAYITNSFTAAETMAATSSVRLGRWLLVEIRYIAIVFREEITGRTLKRKPQLNLEL